MQNRSLLYVLYLLIIVSFSETCPDSIVGRATKSGTADLGSILDRFIPKTSKEEVATFSLGVHIEGKCSDYLASPSTMVRVGLVTCLL